MTLSTSARVSSGFGSFFFLPSFLSFFASRDARNRWETTCIPFLFDVFVSRCRSTVVRRLSSLTSRRCPRFSPFTKSRVAIGLFYGCVLLRAFPLSSPRGNSGGRGRSRSFSQRSRFRVEFNIRILFTSPRRKEGRRMHGGAPICRIIRVWF